MKNSTYGDYIIYADESGDPSFSNNYIDHPVFVLAFCIFAKQDYLKTIQLINQFKFEF